MLNKIKTSKGSGGFTIIEVMIVLAIAALILLIVLLAVPALQRSSRNTQRKNDVSAVSAGVANYISNNNGQVPDTITLNGSDTSVKIDCESGGANGTTCDTGDKNSETAKIGFYTFVKPDPNTPAADQTFADANGGDDPNTLLYVAGWSCNSSSTGLGSANPRTMAFLYQLESGGDSNQCTEQ